MTGPNGPQDPAGRNGDRPAPDVGSVGEEAAKLFGALADLAREHGTDLGGSVAGLAGHAASFAHEVNEHIATGAAECRYCPICRVVHAVRQTSPEVRAHLMVAASSLLQAASAVMESVPSGEGKDGPHRGPEVQHIDLDPEDPTDPSEAP